MSDHLPANHKIEDALIGCVLLTNGKVLEGTVARLSPNSFNQRHHQRLWQTLTLLSAKGQRPTDELLCELLANEKDEVNFLTELVSLKVRACLPLDADAYAEMLLELETRRMIYLGLDRIAKMAGDKSTNMYEVISLAVAEFVEIQAHALASSSVGNTNTWTDLASIIPDLTWTWESWLPNGMVTMLVGEQGTGKSALALAIAACVTEGRNWPDLTSPTESGNLVVWCETESAQAINLDRAKQWGIQTDRIITPAMSDLFADTRLDKPEGWEALEVAVSRCDVRLVIIDSLRGAHRGDENSAAASNITNRLADLAKRTGIPLLVIHHLRKRGLYDKDRRITIDRVRGYGGITQPIRTIWALDRPNPGTPELVRLYVIKSNLAAFPKEVGIEYTELGLTFGEAPGTSHRETELEKAKNFLRLCLAGGRKRSPDIYNAADEAALSKATLLRAKKALGVVTEKTGNSWYWNLPVQKGPF